MIAFRPLRADEIECRVSMVSGKGVSLLLYKDARCDMNILDETVGTDNWQREHYECKGNLFCRVGIHTDDNGWVYKADCGTESYAEKEKGESSDSFKRACFNWGIGRELYTAPFIWINNGDVEIVENNGRKTTKDRFSVVMIETSQDKKIQYLRIENKTQKKTVFEWKNCEDIGKMRIDKLKVKTISNMLLRTQTDTEGFLSYFRVGKIEELTENQFREAIDLLKKKETKNGAEHIAEP